uniref:Histone deacetylase 6 n=1 Tax=Ursus maritimus TaxID=29073 RepID=A0A452TPF5_URSMA
MTSTGQDSTTTRQRRSRHNPHSPPHDSSVTSVRPQTCPDPGVGGGAVESPFFFPLQDLNLEAKTLSGTGLVFDEQLNEFHCLWDDSFPECPERLHAIKEQLIQEGLVDRCVSFQARFAEKEELMLVHSLEYIDLMETTQYMNEGELRILADTYDSVYLHPNSYTCACLASGSVLRLVDAVLGNEIRNGMAIIRPPGHHAQHSLMDGYCMFNHVAVAARTQFAFDQDPSVLYFSIHRYEQGRFWPHLKASNWSTIGFGRGQGYTINVPWNQVGMRDADYIAAFLHLLLPVALEFQPQLVLVAAGFDALQGDPKGEMAATPAGLAQLTHLLMGLAGGKLILSLEGGYNFRSLAEGVSASLHTLLGDPCPILESPGAPCRSAQASLSCALEALEPFWEVLVRSAETLEEDFLEEENVEKEEEGPWQPPALPILTSCVSAILSLFVLCLFVLPLLFSGLWSCVPQSPGLQLSDWRLCVSGVPSPAGYPGLHAHAHVSLLSLLQFNPELVLVSAGFDAARGDPLGGCQVSPEGYAHLTHLLMGLANGRIILILEGGYNLTSISESMAACTRSLLRDPPPLPPLSGALASITETIQVHRRYWRSLRVMKVEDKEGPSSSKSITRKVTPPAHRGSAVRMTAPDGNILDADTGKATSASSVEVSTPDQAKSETAVVALNQDQASDAPTREAMLDKTPSEATIGGMATVGATPGQTTSEEAVGGAEVIQTPPALHTDSQTPPASSVQGATAQISPSKLTESLGTLDLNSEAQAPESQSPEEERLLGEAAEGQHRDHSMLIQSFGDHAVGDQVAFYAVTPLPWCPHLVAVGPIPESGLDVTQPCQDCGTLRENWVCLSCYQVYCGRYVSAHMLQHHGVSGHPLVLSYVDLSTWCYDCEAYVHHQALLDVKSLAHQNKFGEDMPHSH